MFRVIALMPEGTPQHLARAPHLAVLIYCVMYTFKSRQEANEMCSYELEAAEGVLWKLLLPCGKRGTDPLLIPPLRAANVLEDPVYAPALPLVGPVQFLYTQILNSLEQVLPAPG